MDILLLEIMISELKEQLQGTRIAKIHQPTADTLVLKIWTGRANLRLLLSVGQYPRLHLTEADYPNPFTPPRFCQLLRARLSRINSVVQVAGERLVCLEGSGPEGEVRLYAELFGKQGNLALVDEHGTIVDTLVRKREAGSGRQLLPGERYRLPQPLAKVQLVEGAPEIPPECRQGESLRKWLLRTLTPMSPAQAKAIEWHADTLHDAVLALEGFRQTWLQGRCRPQQLEIAGEKLLVACPPAGLATGDESISLSEQLDAIYYPLQFLAGRIGDRGELRKILDRQRKRLQGRLGKIAQEEVAKESFDVQRQHGDLLLANLHRVTKGMTAITILDYNQAPPAEIRIKLDPQLSPQENAQALFKRYKKERRGLDHIARRSAETETELAWLDQLQLSLDEAETPQDLFEVAAELKQAGLYTERKQEPAARKKLPPLPQLNQATSPNGFILLWGRNNRANDHLSTRVAASHDYWFHVHRLPGCHLVLRRDSAAVKVPEEDLRYAAAIAAGYSRARNDSDVEVVCCLVKDIYKVKGAHPGQVSLRRFSTLVVDPVRPDE